MTDEQKALEITGCYPETVWTWLTIAPITKEPKVTIFWNGQVFIFTPEELKISKEEYDRRTKN